jgi:hypothetical protein
MWRGSRERRYVLSHLRSAEEKNGEHETNVYVVFVGCRNPQSPRNRFHDQARCAQDEEGCCLKLQRNISATYPAICVHHVHRCMEDSR